MPFTVEDMLRGILVPLIATLLVTVGASLFTRRNVVLELAYPLAVTGGFLLGYWLLKLGPVVPKLDREWLPYTAVFALAPALIPARGWLTFAAKVIVLGAAVVGCGWLLVPAWPSLEPPRAVYLAVWVTCTLALSVGMLCIARVEFSSMASSISDEAKSDVATAPVAYGGIFWLAMIVAALGTAAALLALSGSLRFAQCAAAAMAAFAGLAAGLWLTKRRFAFDGVVLVYALLISGAMLTGKVNSFSSIPTASYLILPLAPMAYATAMRNRKSGRSIKQMLLPTAVAVACCALAMGLALAAEFGSE